MVCRGMQESCGLPGIRGHVRQCMRWGVYGACKGRQSVCGKGQHGWQYVHVRMFPMSRSKVSGSRFQVLISLPVCLDEVRMYSARFPILKTFCHVLSRYGMYYHALSVRTLRTRNQLNGLMSMSQIIITIFHGESSPYINTYADNLSHFNNAYYKDFYVFISTL